jgi:hypothetical protein
MQKQKLSHISRFLIILLALLPGAVYAQISGRERIKSTDESLNFNSKNSIYGQASFILIGYSATVNYERMLFPIGRNKSTCACIRAGYGYWAYWTGGGPAGILTANMVFFKRVNHLEAGFGAVALYDKKHYEMMVDEYNNYNGDPPGPKSECMIYNPAINLGYRYQNPDGNFIFRIGISYPEGGYTGLGYTF